MCQCFFPPFHPVVIHCVAVVSNSECFFSSSNSMFCIVFIWEHFCSEKRVCQCLHSLWCWLPVYTRLVLYLCWTMHTKSVDDHWNITTRPQSDLEYQCSTLSIPINIAYAVYRCKHCMPLWLSICFAFVNDRACARAFFHSFRSHLSIGFHFFSDVQPCSDIMAKHFGFWVCFTNCFIQTPANTDIALFCGYPQMVTIQNAKSNVQ